MKQLFLGIALAGATLLAGCAGPQATASNAPPPVPPPRQEEIPLPPVTATPLIWQPGHWNWNGSGYIWNQGRYVPRAGHGNLYMPGYWAQTNSGWEWQPPHWL
jgi:WXXGXW repeat (2 copies)